jgi:hypothetical protein
MTFSNSTAAKFEDTILVLGLIWIIHASIPFGILA